MTTDRVNRALAIFREACERNDAERSAFLAQACGDDGQLRAQVESMLAFDKEDDDEAPSAIRNVLSDLANAATDPGDGAPMPDTIGGYRIIRLIARGGMGDVYEAQQQQPARRVAIKVARASGTTTERARRFELEAQLLARLQHPRIAQIIEAGTTSVEDGAQPFFVMELVEGQSLTPYAAEHLDTARDKLELMAALCDAIGFAHQRGVIHRDLKPDNVMIEAGGKPKVLDFGVAKVEDAGGFGAATLRTEAGRVIGTLGYMAPEQLGGRTEGLGPEADVYSLGVMIYQLLSGRLPHELDAVTLTRALAVVTTTDAPLLGVIRPEYRGDIEAVVAKALEKEARHRYRDAGALQADIERFLRGEPTLARPAGPLLKFTRWTRRNRALATAVCGLIVALSAGTATLWVKNRQVQGALDEVRLLADAKYLERAAAAADRLWPTRRHQIGNLEQWLSDFAERANRLPEFERVLANIRGHGVLAQGAWTFEDDFLQLKHDTLAQLLLDLEAFQGPNGLATRVARRRDLAGTIEAETTGAYATEWQEAVTRIRQSEVYDGLQMEPMIGFVPLGPDPSSGLEEFLHFETHDGDLPERDEQKHRFTVTEQTGLIFVLIPGGEFLMGAQSTDPEADHYDPEAWPQESPVHRVQLSAFLLSKYEMTEGQWSRVTGQSPRRRRQQGASDQEPLARPMQRASWRLCMQVMARLELLVPTEAQWEYAARAGTATVWPFVQSTTSDGSDFATLAKYANLCGQECKDANPRFIQVWDAAHVDKHDRAAPVGSYEPSVLGLHDVIGNVFEWCADGHQDYPASLDNGDVPRPLGEGNQVVFRGGCSQFTASRARSAMRGFVGPGAGMQVTGLRPAARVRLAR